MIEAFGTSFSWIKPCKRCFSSFKINFTPSSLKSRFHKKMHMPGGAEELDCPDGHEITTRTGSTVSECSSESGSKSSTSTSYDSTSDIGTPGTEFVEMDWSSGVETMKTESVDTSSPRGAKETRAGSINLGFPKRLQHKINMIPEPAGFPFMKLPAEIRLSILEECAPIPSERQGANSMETFLAMLQVSKAVQDEAYVACLPRIALALWTKKGVRSFRALLQRRPELGCRMRYLWLGTGKYDEEELDWAVDILKVATQLRSFACGEFLFSRVVNTGALAETCERVTLMNVEKGVEYEARGVTQLRLCAGTYSTKEKFPDVTNLCFNARRRNATKDERIKVEYEAVDRWLESIGRFAMVERDGRRVSERGLGIKFAKKREGKPDIFSIVLPTRWTEWDIWSADAVGAGIWDLCRLPTDK